jgi:hypothetical protein
MANERKPRVKTVPPIEPLIETVIEECVRVQRMSFNDLMAEMKPGLIAPPSIPLGLEQIYTSSKGWDALGKLTNPL